MTFDIFDIFVLLSASFFLAMFGRCRVANGLRGFPGGSAVSPVLRFAALQKELHTREERGYLVAGPGR